MSPEAENEYEESGGGLTATAVYDYQAGQYSSALNNYSSFIPILIWLHWIITLDLSKS